LWVPESAKSLLFAMQKAVLEAGAHYLTWFVPDGVDRWTMGNRLFYEYANDTQLKFFPDKYMRGAVDQMDHMVAILAEDDMHALQDIDSSKIMMHRQAMKPFKDWRFEKEGEDKLTWTLALYGTPAMAKEAKMSLDKYWSEIIKACFLDEVDPIKKWQGVFEEIERVRRKLNSLKIAKLHVVANDTDLWIVLGEKRQWLGGSGRNIPSFELFTSPDCRFTEGTISFNQPLYSYGNLIKDIQLWFEEGKVVKAKASKGQKVLEEMVKVKNADRIGEFSLTDGRMSRITKFMANTLFDENVGGVYGNTHLALGSSYHDAYSEDVKKVKKVEWEKFGFNDSAVHTDIMATTDRTVTAVLEDGDEKVIYREGKFTI